LASKAAGRNLAKGGREVSKASSETGRLNGDHLPEDLTLFDFPQTHWRRIRTTHMVERLNRQIRRRTRVVSIFPNEASCLRLITALLMETSEARVTGRVYLSITDT